MDKRKHPQEMEDDSSEEEEQPIQFNQKGGMEEEVNLDFAFFDPKPEQFQSVKTLLNGYLESISFKSSQLSDLVLNQVYIGTMVGVEDEKDIFGFVSLMNLQQHKNEAVLGEIVHYLQQKSQQYNNKHDQFLNILQNQKTGLLLNERILNLAPQLVPILHNQLREDIEWTLKDDPQDPVLDLKYLIVITKCYKEQQKQVQKKKINDNQEYIYQKFEDYAFLQKSIMKFIFQSESQKINSQVSDYIKTEQEGQTCYRLIYIIELQDYLEQIHLLDQYLQQ